MTLHRQAINRRICALLLAGFGILLWLPGKSGADNIDEELIRHGPKIMKFLRQKEYQSVGVHNFQLQKGDAAPSYSGGVINNNLAARVENALVLALNPEEKPIGIVKDSSSVAASKLKGASYKTAEDRAKLFTVEYPLAWGVPPKSVTPDVFLAGKVTLSADMKKTTILIAAFDRKHPEKLEKVDEFEVSTDRYILADSGQGYSLSKGKGSFRRGIADEDIFASISEDDKAKKAGKVGVEPGGKVGVEPGTQPAGTSPTKDQVALASLAQFPVEFKMFYNGAEQPLTVDPNASGITNLSMRDPKPGEKVTFGLRNRTDQKLGVVLTINGISTLYEETGQPDQMTQWVLEPNKDYLIKGFYQKDKNTFIEIEGLPEDLSREKFSDLGGAARAGLIHLCVFRPGTQVAGQPSAPAFSRSLRKLSAPTLATTKPETPFDLQKLVVQNANFKGGRGLMAWGASEGKEALQEAKIGTNILTDLMVIRYYALPRP